MTSLMEKYGLNPEYGLYQGDDQAWECGDYTPERMRAEIALSKACVVGVETYPFREFGEPGYAGVTYPQGFAMFTVVCRVIEPDPTIVEGIDTVRKVITTRVNRVSDFWFTIHCVGVDEVMEVLETSQPHPDSEETNR